MVRLSRLACISACLARTWTMSCDQEDEQEAKMSGEDVKAMWALGMRYFMGCLMTHSFPQMSSFYLAYVRSSCSSSGSKLLSA